MKILLAAADAASFIARDAKILRERHEVTEYILPARVWPNPDLENLVRRHDLVLLWFASGRAVPLVWRARRERKPIVVVVGGYEAVWLPEIQYGTANGWLQRRRTRWILNQAARVLTVSQASQRSLTGNFSVAASRLRLIYHGFEDLWGRAEGARRSEVLTVGDINASVWLRKGQQEFFRAAALMPDVPFVHAGKVDQEFLLSRIESLPANVRLLGSIPFERLGEAYGAARVYFQASRHESFGCAVAEAMLCGCIPVVSGLYALPEVVGETGVIARSLAEDDIVAAIRAALDLPSSVGEKARQRVLSEFSYARRRDQLLAVIDEAVGVGS